MGYSTFRLSVRLVMVGNATTSFLMHQTLKAIYRHSAFILQTACNLPEE
jgi:hypothetical protein